MAVITESAVVVLAAVCAENPPALTPWLGMLVVPAGESPDICWWSGLVAPGHGAFKGFSLWKHFCIPFALKNYREETVLDPPSRERGCAGKEAGQDVTRAGNKGQEPLT